MKNPFDIDRVTFLAGVLNITNQGPSIDTPVPSNAIEQSDGGPVIFCRCYPEILIRECRPSIEAESGRSHLGFSGECVKKIVGQKRFMPSYDFFVIELSHVLMIMSKLRIVTEKMKLPASNLWETQNVLST